MQGGNTGPESAKTSTIAPTAVAQKGLESTKHSLIDRANYLVFVAVAITALIVGFCGVGIYYLTNMLSFQARVLEAKTTAEKNISANAKNINNLRDGLIALKEDPQLLSVADNDRYREDPLLLVANALPVRENLAAFGSNLTTLAIRLGDEAAAVESISPGAMSGSFNEVITHNTTATPLYFTFTANGSMGCTPGGSLEVVGQAAVCTNPLGLSRVLWNFEHSTRAIYLNSVTLAFRGSGATQQVEMSASGNGFYTAEQAFVLNSQTIRGGRR